MRRFYRGFHRINRANFVKTALSTGPDVYETRITAEMVSVDATEATAPRQRGRLRRRTGAAAWSLVEIRQGAGAPTGGNSVSITWDINESEKAFYLTSTEIDGERYLWVTVMAPATDERTLTSLLDRIADAPPSVVGER
jgi:hypothetical protein